MKLWFKAKTHGYGWAPASWEGWLVILVFLVFFYAGMAVFITNPHISSTDTILFLAYIFSLTALLLSICHRTGEPLRWRWGNKK